MEPELAEVPNIQVFVQVLNRRLALLVGLVERRRHEIIVEVLHERVH